MVNFNGDYAEFKIKVDLTKWISHLNKKNLKQTTTKKKMIFSQDSKQ